MDYQEVTEAIRRMRPYHKLYKLLKRELTRLGHWRNLPRGNPQKGWQASHKQNVVNCPVPRAQGVKEEND